MASNDSLSEYCFFTIISFPNQLIQNYNKNIILFDILIIKHLTKLFSFTEVKYWK